MTTKVKRVFGMVALAGLMILPLAAQASTSSQYPQRIDRREARQQQRIRRNYRSGNLTQAEARRLAHRERATQRFEARARSDGRISSWERRRLNQHLRRNSRAIRRQSHDYQRRY
jgi:hypothetical protein